MAKYNFSTQSSEIISNWPPLFTLYDIVIIILIFKLVNYIFLFDIYYFCRNNVASFLGFFHGQNGEKN